VFQSIPFDRMCALYRVADAMVITSVRDGMNLVAYEYIACQQEQPGTLILSEFAGAAQSLGQCRRHTSALFRMLPLPHSCSIAL
jgi:trehalose-6-phosphate synthase